MGLREEGAQGREMDGPRVVMRGWSVLTLPHGRNNNTVGPGWKDAVGHRRSSTRGNDTPGTHKKKTLCS